MICNQLDANILWPSNNTFGDLTSGYNPEEGENHMDKHIYCSVINNHEKLEIP